MIATGHSLATGLGRFDYVTHLADGRTANAAHGVSAVREAG